MFILTEGDKNKIEEEGCVSFSIFDDSTGLKYSIAFKHHQMRLYIESASQAIGEYGAGIEYFNEEALSVWTQLGQLFTGIKDKIWHVKTMGTMIGLLTNEK